MRSFRVSSLRASCLCSRGHGRLCRPKVLLHDCGFLQLESGAALDLHMRKVMMMMMMIRPLAVPYNEWAPFLWWFPRSCKHFPYFGPHFSIPAPVFSSGSQPLLRPASD